MIIPMSCAFIGCLLLAFFFFLEIDVDAEFETVQRRYIYLKDSCSMHGELTVLPISEDDNPA